MIDTLASRLGIVVALVLAPGAQQQWPPRSSEIVIGDGTTSKGSHPDYTGAGALPFQNAIAAVANGGGIAGTIEVMPGSWSIGSTIVVDVPGVRIVGSLGARLVAGAQLAGPIFDVRADDVVIERLSLQDHRAQPPESAVVLASANRFALSGCRVVVSDAGTAASTSYAIHLTGAAERYGHRIDSNSFTAGGPPASGQFPGAPKRAFLRSERGRDLRVVGNEFRGWMAGAPGSSVGNAISLLDEQWTTITANTFSWLVTPLGNPDANALVTSTAERSEAGHLVFASNFLELCGGECMVNASGDGYVAITGNVFGRAMTGPSGTVRLAYGAGNLIASNGFHFKNDAHPAITAVGGTAPSFGTNNFFASQAPQIVLTDVDGPSIQSNQFHTLVAPAHAIALVETVPSGRSAVVCANSMFGGWQAALAPTSYALHDCATVGNPIH